MQYRQRCCGRSAVFHTHTLPNYDAAKMGAVARLRRSPELEQGWLCAIR
jgi:hypothetical protein